MRIVKDPNSIYGRLFSFVEKNPDNKNISNDINYFLNHFYMRLSAQTYCLANNISISSKMTP